MIRAAYFCATAMRGTKRSVSSAHVQTNADWLNRIEAQFRAALSHPRLHRFILAPTTAHTRNRT